uniref:Membrane protein n=1 Tax=Moorena bouillonii bAprat14 TaxID=2530358 RepID=A0A6G5NVX0_9CYAN|nr:membrane protein [Moorena bouillonii bAprat14]
MHKADVFSVQVPQSALDMWLELYEEVHDLIKVVLKLALT